LFADDCLQYIARLGNVREVDLGLDFAGISLRHPRGLRRCLRFIGGAEMSAQLFGFVLFQRTGMGLLLADPNLRECIENSLAFNFQFPGQIVNSNLAHPPYLPPTLFPLSLHINLTVSVSAKSFVRRT
jgi:hypothetical protein